MLRINVSTLLIQQYAATSVSRVHSLIWTFVKRAQPYGDALFAAVKGALKPKCLTFSPLYIPAHSRASAHNLPADRGTAAVAAAAAMCK